MAAATREVILIGGDDDSFSFSGGGGGADVDVVLNSRVDQQQNNCSSPTAMSSSSSSAPLVARHQQRMPQHQQQHCHPQDELVIDLQGQNDSCDEMSSTSSKSSSSSSGIPSPWKTTLNSAESPHEDRPPSIIHTTSSPVEKVDEMVALKPLNGVNPTTNRKPTKKKLLTNDNAAICNEDETSAVSECTGLSTSSSTRLSKRRGDNPSRRKGWNRKRGPASTTTSKPKQLSIGNTTGDDRDDSSCSCTISSSAIKSKSTNANGDDTANKHFHCYLLRSLDPDHPLMTYIGFTTHPERRIRQHNGILKNGGARRTKRSGRPWTFVCVIHGFEDKITALQFEWAWQNVDKSVAFRDALGGDVKLAKKMKRSMGPKARLEELRVLLKECLPFCLYSLTVYFPERYYHDIFSGILRKGKNGNPYKKDDDESDAFEPLMNFEICSLENMPVAREAAQFKEKKKARQEAKELVKTKTTKVANSDSEVADWLGEEDSCWSDLLDEEGGDNVNDDRDEDASFLETITENDASIALSSDGRMESDSMSADSHPKNNMPNNEMDDLSRDFISFSMDSSREQTPIKEWMMEDTKALSTMLSADRSSSLDDDASVAGALREPEGIVRENQRINKHVNSSVHDRSIDVGLNRDVIDLCDSPL